MRIRQSLISLTAIASLGVLIASGSTGGDSSNGGGKTGGGSATHPAEDDVKLTNCATGDGGYLTATVQITNHSTKKSNYLVTVVFDSPDGKTQFDTGNVAVNDLGPGQSSQQDAATLTQAKGKFVCKISDVTRYAA